MISVTKMRFRRIMYEQNKPWFKRFEMYGNLPVTLQHGTVVSASITDQEVYG